MKKMLTFVPLAIGISAALIYLFNVIQFRMLGNAVTLLDALNSLKVYLYVSIAGFVIYFIIKIFQVINLRKKALNDDNIDEDYEYFEEQNKESIDTAKDSYNNYTPIYEKETMGENIIDKVIINNPVNVETKKCCNCKKEIDLNDQYCSSCGANQKENEKILSPFVKNLINVLEIVILILVIYFLLNMLFDFKEKQDPNFKSPFKVSMTK